MHVVQAVERQKLLDLVTCSSSTYNVRLGLASTRLGYRLKPATVRTTDTGKPSSHAFLRHTGLATRASWTISRATTREGHIQRGARQHPIDEAHAIIPLLWVCILIYTVSLPCRPAACQCIGLSFALTFLTKVLRFPPPCPCPSQNRLNLLSERNGLACPFSRAGVSLCSAHFPHM